MMLYVVIQYTNHYNKVNVCECVYLWKPIDFDSKSGSSFQSVVWKVVGRRHLSGFQIEPALTKYVQIKCAMSILGMNKILV